MAVRLAYALLALALLAGAASGWVEYLERDRDFDRGQLEPVPDYDSPGVGDT